MLETEEKRNDKEYFKLPLHIRFILRVSIILIKVTIKPLMKIGFTPYFAIYYLRTGKEKIEVEETVTYYN